VGILLSILILTILIFLIVHWIVHISMVKNEGCKYGWGTFKRFKKEFDKYEWNNHGYSSSLFNYCEGGYIHADIYKFNNKGMIMRDPFSYLLSKIYIRKHCSYVKPKRNVVKWK
jgi:competence protein ComGC